MSHPRGYDPASPPGGKPKARGAPRWRGPASTLTTDIQRELVKHLRKGATKRMAAALAGTTETRLQTWLRRGRESIEEGKRSRYTQLVFEVERAEAEYQMSLVEAAEEAIHDKGKNDKIIRWRLGVSAPKDFTIPREPPTVGANALGPLFELVTPEQARTRLEEKLGRFLEEYEKEMQEAAAPAPPAAPEAGDGS